MFRLIARSLLLCVRPGTIAILYGMPTVSRPHWCGNDDSREYRSVSCVLMAREMNTNMEMRGRTCTLQQLERSLFEKSMF